MGCVITQSGTGADGLKVVDSKKRNENSTRCKGQARDTGENHVREETRSRKECGAGM
jgi:hypothetical protein